jgi:hypothetical protein
MSAAASSEAVRSLALHVVKQGVFVVLYAGFSAAREEVDFLEIRTEERFAARKTHLQATQGRRLVQDVLDPVGRQLPVSGLSVILVQIDIAMDAVVAAPLGQLHVQLGRAGRAL